MGTTAYHAIGEALKTNTALTTLYLNSNNIGDAGAIAIGEALQNKTALTTLDLRYNNIGDAGAIAIGEALQNKTALTTLDLRYNNIGDAGVIAFGEALQNNTALTTLDLGSNNIGDAGAAAIGEVLKANTALTWLNLGSNPILCSNHGDLDSGLDIDGCECKGSWTGIICDQNVKRRTTRIAVGVVFSVAVFIAAAVFAYCTCLRPYLERWGAEREFGRAHPIVVKTVGGDVHTLEDWGHCKDLKLALVKLAPDLGKPATFMLADNNGEIDPKYGSAYRTQLMAGGTLDYALDDSGNGVVATATVSEINLTLLYTASAVGAVNDSHV